MLTKEQILKAKDLVTQEVDVPEWGGTVIVKGMTGTERDSFEQAIIDTKGKSTKTNLANIRARLCSLTMVDDKGERLFADSDMIGLGKKAAKAIDRVFAVAQDLNGMSAVDVEELAKNSEAAQSEDSTSS
jgi:hypothetical protein